MRKLKQNKGITLIALVITIVVMLILAGVSISMLFGSNGIINRAKEAKEASEKQSIIENIKFDIATKQTKNLGSIDEDEFLEILNKYGTISEDENIITTSKGNYQIKISEIYDGKIENPLTTTPLESWEYTISDQIIVLKKYIGVDEKIYIPNTFTIGDSLYNTVLDKTSSSLSGTNGPFANNTILKAVKFDNNINLKNNSSWGIFYGCSNLVTVYNLPNISEASYLFNNCSSLKNAPELPEGITNMDHTFYGCVSLTKAPIIPSTVVQMYATFKACKNLEGIIDIKAANITNVSDCFSSRNKQIYLKVDNNSESFQTLNNIIDEWPNITFYGEKVFHIACYGDSLTRGAGGNGTTYVNALASKLKRKGNVTNLGVGGENTSTIAGRQGGIPYIVGKLKIPSDTTPVEIVISAKDGSDVKPALQDNNKSIVQGLNPCYINSIEGRIDYIKGKYYFTRLLPGMSVDISDNTEILTDGMVSYRDTDVIIIWTGQNDSATIENISEIITKQQKMIEYANTDKYVVIGLLYSGDKVNEEMAKAYGEHFLDVRSALSKDTTHTVSTDYKSDGVHLNSDGYTIVGTQVYNKLLSLGYITE